MTDILEAVKAVYGREDQTENQEEAATGVDDGGSEALSKVRSLRLPAAASANLLSCSFLHVIEAVVHTGDLLRISTEQYHEGLAAPRLDSRGDLPQVTNCTLR